MEPVTAIKSNEDDKLRKQWVHITIWFITFCFAPIFILPGIFGLLGKEAENAASGLIVFVIIGALVLLLILVCAWSLMYFNVL